MIIYRKLEVIGTGIVALQDGGLQGEFAGRKGLVHQDPVGSREGKYLECCPFLRSHFVILKIFPRLWSRCSFCLLVVLPANAFRNDGRHLGDPGPPGQCCFQKWSTILCRCTLRCTSHRPGAIRRLECHLQCPLKFRFMPDIEACQQCNGVHP